MLPLLIGELLKTEIFLTIRNLKFKNEFYITLGEIKRNNKYLNFDEKSQEMKIYISTVIPIKKRCNFILRRKLANMARISIPCPSCLLLHFNLSSA